ncbi:hypothetical protein A2U01_0005031, partial [Trifolium medium]|nr:hypothetical protein [Trifolium medium]
MQALGEVVYIHDNCGSKGLFWLAAILQGPI